MGGQGTATAYYATVIHTAYSRDTATPGQTAAATSRFELLLQTKNLRILTLHVSNVDHGALTMVLVVDPSPQHCVRCQLACCAHISTQWGR